MGKIVVVRFFFVGYILILTLPGLSPALCMVLQRGPIYIKASARDFRTYRISGQRNYVRVRAYMQTRQSLCCLHHGTQYGYS